MAQTAKQTDEDKAAPPSDLIWGLRRIGKRINRSEEQTAHP